MNAMCGFDLCEELTHAAKFVVSLLDNLMRGKAGEFLQAARENRIEKSGGRFVIQMRASFGFRDYLVNQFHFEKIRAR